MFSQQVSNNQDREEQMQTATEPNRTFSVPSSVGQSTEQQSSNTFQSPPLASLRAGDITTDDEDIPRVNPLQRESSSEGVKNFHTFCTADLNIKMPKNGYRNNIL